MKTAMDDDMTASSAASFRSSGFVVLPGFFAPELMGAIERLIGAHFGVDPDFFHNDEFLKNAETAVIPWFPQPDAGPEFQLIESDPRLGRLTEALLGPAWRSQYCMVMYSKQGTSGQAWHQDCAPENSEIFNLNRLVYTADIEEHIGGELMLVPGSHRHGLLPAGDPHGDLPGQVTLTPRKGDLVLLHGHIWHRVRPVHGGHRSSTNYRAVPSGSRADITDICVYRNMRYRFSTSEVVEIR